MRFEMEKCKEMSLAQREERLERTIRALATLDNHSADNTVQHLVRFKRQSSELRVGFLHSILALTSHDYRATLNTYAFINDIVIINMHLMTSFKTSNSWVPEIQQC
ncbi:hypothetical protein AB6A40_011325 [Gnathostoma spinigerum]|uniref:Uncharacterized protein n=1 Tax=Gnathostoma spinigerum TaxID=75299 RepID=A0ABD6EZ11_9BILA